MPFFLHINFFRYYLFFNHLQPLAHTFHILLIFIYLSKIFLLFFLIFEILFCAVLPLL
jgi:hypothetical protein